jgi:hypothetical protein
LTLAPAVALATLRVNRRLALLVAVAVVALAGFWLEFRSEAWSDAQIAARFEAIPNPTSKQLEEFNADGASKTAVLLFGLPISLIYAGLWLLLVRGGGRLLVKLNHA